MNLLNRIAQLEAKRMKILVLGDIILDHYEYGEVTRISPEAPVQIVQLDREKYILGGAGNVANNLAVLKTYVLLAGIIGPDQNGQRIKDCLEESSINSCGLIVDEIRPTTVKRRTVSGKNQLLRVDYEQTHPIDSALQIRLLAFVQQNLENIDAIILSDYAKGVLTPELSKQVIALANITKIPIVVDGKPKNARNYTHATLIKPNLKEAKEMMGANAHLFQIETMGQSLSKELDANVFITLGDQGIYAFEKNGKHTIVPAKKVIHVYDVTGAGDTVTAISALGLAHGMSLVDIAELANTGGRLVVQKPGTATVTWEEIRTDLDSITLRESYKRHKKIWGYEQEIANFEGPNYCGKKLVLKKQYQCSIHYHKEKDEVFYINTGHVLLLIDGKEHFMKPGSRIRIPPETKHRFIGLTYSEIIEISTHHKEEDSYRDEPSGRIPICQFREYLKKYGNRIKA